VSHGAHFLYVEDDSLSREVMQILLNEVIDAGSVTILPTSDNFIERVRQLEHLPDFILLDIYVEPVNGYDLLTQIRADSDFAHTKVIAVTASVMSTEVALLKAKGFDGAIAKPLDFATFPSLIHRIEAGEVIWQV